MFDYEILEEHDTYDKLRLNVREKFFVEEYCTKEPFGFNKTGGGSGNSEPCAETREKMSVAKKGKKHAQHKPRKKETNKRGPYKPRPDTWADNFEWWADNK